MREIKKPEGFEAYRSVAELAEFLGVHPRSIERWYRDGKLPEPMKVGTMKLWSPAACRDVLADIERRFPNNQAEERRITQKHG